MYVELKNGVNMPVIGLGTSLVEGQDCVLNIKQALQLGYRHIDTASAYKNEKSIGSAIKESNIPREEIFITTKINAIILFIELIAFLFIIFQIIF